MRKTKKTLAILAIVAMVLAMLPVQVFAATTSAVDKDRYAGADGIATALDVASNWTKADTVILAPADDDNLVDALAAAPLAGQENAPILLTFKSGLNADVKAKIAALGAKKVYVVGAAANDAVVNALTGVTVEKLAGADRWATADAINAKLTNVAGTFVVGYDAIPDALSAASYAAANKYAIVLTNVDGTVNAAKLVGSKTYLVGGTGVVKDYAGATDRFGGADRYATNEAVVKGLTYEFSKVYIANGETLVDALVAAPLAAQAKAAVLLANTSVAGADYINGKLASDSKVIALGGTGVVSDAVKAGVGYQAPAVESVSAINTSIGVGGQTGFQFKDAAGSVVSMSGATYSISDPAYGTIDPVTGLFTAAKAGAVTVTATVGGKVYTTTVNVYGTVSSVKFSPANPVVANGVSAQTITVNAVDVNGVPVSNFNGSATFAVTTNNSAAKYPAATVTSPTYATASTITTLTFKNGQAQFQVVGNTIAGLSDTVTVSAMLDSNGIPVSNFVNASATYTTVAQNASTIKVTAPKTVAANSANTANVTIEVDDQAGKPVLSGVYGLNVNITGAAKYSDGTTTDKTISFIGGQANPTVTLTSVQGVTGATTITVSGAGLTVGTATIQSVVVGNAAKLAVANANASATSNDFVTGSAGQSYNVTTVDVNGYPTGAYTGTTAKVYVTKADGTVATNIKVTSGGSTANIPADGSGVAIVGGAFTLTDDTTTANVGAYTVVVKDTATTSALAAADSFTFNVKADTVNAQKLAMKVANNYVAASNPTTTVTAQITDQYGNVLATAGVPVTFSATTGASAKAAFNGGTQVAAPSVVVNTDTNGVATATFTAQAYNGTVWTIGALATGYTTTPTSATVTVVYQTVSALKVNLKATATNSTTQVVAGSGLTTSVDQLDQYGNVIATATEDDNIKVTVSNPNAVNFPAVGTTGVTLDTTAGTIQGTASQVNAYLALGLTGKQVGAVTFSAQDLSVNATSGSAGISVVAGVQTGFALFDANGKVVSATNPVSVAANTPIALTVKPVDSQGNQVVSNAVYTVNFGNLGGGNFTTVSGGAAVASITFANGAASQTVYYVNATAGSYAPSVSYAQTLNAATSTVTAAASTVTAGASNITLTVTPKDQLGNNISGLAASAFTVASSLAGATPSVVSATETAAGSGIYTVVVTDTKAGAQTLTVSVNGTALTQTAAVTVNPAVIDAAQSTATIDTALALGATSTVTATAKDQYGNVISGHTFYLDITVTNTTSTTAESYTVDGTAYTATTTNVALVGTTNASGVVTFTIAVPATVDAGDGVSVQVKTASAGSNVGSAFSFTN